MTEIIKIETLENGAQAVSARELYKFLEIKTAFKDWFPRMCEYGFTDQVDFCSFLSESTGGRPAQDYVITIDMAKEICMIQRSEKGKQARQYFIECERQLQMMQQDSYMITDKVARAQKWIEEEQERQRLQALADQQAAEIEEAAPKLEYHDRVLQASSSSMNTREVAADYGMSAIRLNRILMDLHIQYKCDNRYYLYSRYSGKGYVESKTNLYDSGCKAKTSMKWTQAGREFIYNKLHKIGINPVGYVDDDYVDPAELERLDAGVINSALH